MKSKLVALAAAFAFTFTGASLALAAPPKGAIGAYVWVGDAAGNAAPAAAYSFNSANKANTVKKTGAGTYEVTLGGVGTSGGHAQVSAYGGGNAQCKAVRWVAKGSDTVVSVACFSGKGDPADSTFSLLFVM